MEFRKEDSRIWLGDEDGNMVAEVTWVTNSDGSRNIWHTFVSDSLRGQGVAGKLMQQAADDLRESGAKAELTCSYAIRWFAEHPEYQDVLVSPEAEAEKAAGPGTKACSLRPKAK